MTGGKKGDETNLLGDDDGINSKDGNGGVDGELDGVGFGSERIEDGVGDGSDGSVEVSLKGKRK